MKGKKDMKHIFVIDDDKEIRELIRKYLQKEGYKVTTFWNGQNVENEIKRLSPDLLVLDIMMPGIDGMELCKNIRKETDIPIIFVSARGDEVDRIIGLEIGGDDYLSKPFSPRELIARMKNIFRRLDKAKESKEVETEVFTIKNLEIIESMRVVKVDGQSLKLTGKEYEALLYLVKNQDLPLHRERLLEEVWGYASDSETRVVDDVIKRLRKKLRDAKSSVEIETVWGYGYKVES